MEGWAAKHRCYIKRTKKATGRRKSRARRDVISLFFDPWLFFLLLSVSAIICFLFSFTVFIVSLLHCEHLAIGVQALWNWGEGGLSR